MKTFKKCLCDKDDYEIVKIEESVRFAIQKEIRNIIPPIRVI